MCISMSVPDDARVLERMPRWYMDPGDPEAFRLAREWLAYADDNRYYTQAIFMPYSVAGVRGILLTLFMGSCSIFHVYYIGHKSQWVCPKYQMLICSQDTSSAAEVC